MAGGYRVNRTEMADALGCSVATVSRICSGDRAPSLALMIEIRRVLSWSVESQVDEMGCGNYPAIFEEKMERRRMRQRLRRPRRQVAG